MNSADKQQTAGIAMVCDRHGLVLEVIHDGLDISDRINIGETWTQIIDTASIDKANNFLTQLDDLQAVFNWELNVPIGNAIITLHFAGLIQDDHQMIVAAKTGQDSTILFEEFMRMNNEQSNSLRTALKENAELSSSKLERDSILYNELSRLNNELVTLQRELAKKNAELATLNDLKNRFLGMAAHDLRAPLGIILGYCEFLMEEASAVLSQEHLEFLSIIRSSTHFMRQLVDDFLDISVIESGKFTFNWQVVDLVDLVKQNIRLNTPLATKKHIQLTFNSREQSLDMVIDAAKIEQVLNNLISNAIKFSHPNSAIIVDVRQGKGNEIPSLNIPDKESIYAIISVQDQGQGIPEKDLDKLFNIFQRTSVKSTGGEKSSGLGLAIARQIVTGHYGIMWVNSQVGVGSTFYAALPLQPPE